MNKLTRNQSKIAIQDLVLQFQKGITIFKDPRKYDEAKVRSGFLDKFFEALGWPVSADQRKYGVNRNVIVEDRAGKGNKKRPDYGFYINGQLKFFVEAKAPWIDLHNNLDAIFQLKSYVWSQRGALGILTDFEEFLVFTGIFRPHHDKPNLGKIPKFCFDYDTYLDNFEILYDLFSMEAVAEGSIEKLVSEIFSPTKKDRDLKEIDLFKLRGASSVDEEFLASLNQWRAIIAQGMAKQNEFKDGAELTEAVERFLDRLIFSRIVEDRGIERSHTLRNSMDLWEKKRKDKPLYNYLIDQFQALAPQFNGTLFHQHPISENIKYENDTSLVKIIKSLYFPESPYRFDSMPVHLLGQVYEQFLGSVIELDTKSHQAKTVLKPEVKHAGGIYYTPKYIVDVILEKTLSDKVKKSTPKKILDLKIIDPACGSGSFLLAAFQYLMDWHLKYYGKEEKISKKFRKDCYFDDDGDLHLTLQKKRDILLSCIHGVDIDPQAIEVAQMGLYLKLLEGEVEESLAMQRSLELFKAEKYLPDLSKNIICGNSLINLHQLGPISGFQSSDLKRINAFDWAANDFGFGNIMKPISEGGSGGFDVAMGNPPYIRVQTLNKFAPIEVNFYKDLYQTAREGNYDIYNPFIEKSLGLLNDQGVLGFITPHKWWQAGYGESLRALIRNGNHYSHIVDFSYEQVFENATTYTAISILPKNSSNKISYERTSPHELRHKGQNATPIYKQSVNWEDLGDGKWYPGVRQHLRSLFDRLRNSPPFLGDNQICTRVFQGLKTSKDPVYVMDYISENERLYVAKSQALNRTIELEKGVLKPIVKGKELKPFFPRKSSKLLLFPYYVENDEAKLIPPDMFSTQYPLAWDYLQLNKDTLEKREDGRMKNENWYAYIYPKSLTLFSKTKLITPDLVGRMSFSFDQNGEYYFLGGASGGYGIIPTQSNQTLALMGILNSKLMEWLTRPPGLSTPFRGNYFSCEARFINLLPIRFPTNLRDLSRFESVVRDCISSYHQYWEAGSDKDKHFYERQIEALETEIDDRVYSIFELTPNERKELTKVVLGDRLLN